MNIFAVLYEVQRWSYVCLGLGMVLVVVGVVAMLQPQKRIGRQVPASDEQLLDVAYEAGVVAVGAE